MKARKAVLAAQGRGDGSRGGSQWGPGCGTRWHVRAGYGTLLEAAPPPPPPPRGAAQRSASACQEKTTLPASARPPA